MMVAGATTFNFDLAIFCSETSTGLPQSGQAPPRTSAVGTQP